MKKSMKKSLIAVIAAICMVGCMACGSAASAGALPDSAVARSQDSDLGKIYIDDEAIAMAGSLSSTDPALQQSAQDALTLVNQQRAAAGLAALTWNNDLAAAALVRAQEIVGTFSHTRPNGSAWYTVNSNVMYGENLAKNYSSATDVVNAWMASPTHKANVMDSGFKTIGISIYKADDGHWYWAQEFGY